MTHNQISYIISRVLQTRTGTPGSCFLWNKQGNNAGAPCVSFSTLIMSHYQMKIIFKLFIVQVFTVVKLTVQQLLS